MPRVTTCSREELIEKTAQKIKGRITRNHVSDLELSKTKKTPKQLDTFLRGIIHVPELEKLNPTERGVVLDIVDRNLKKLRDDKVDAAQDLFRNQMDHFISAVSAENTYDRIMKFFFTEVKTTKSSIVHNSFRSLLPIRPPRSSGKLHSDRNNAQTSHQRIPEENPGPSKKRKETAKTRQSRRT